MAAEPVLLDQKTRTLEALERRFELAEAELHRQRKSQKRPHEENNSATLNVNSSSFDTSTSVFTPCTTSTSSKKGIFAFAGHTATQDDEANDPTYFQLSHLVHENLLATSSKITDRRTTIVNQVLHELLQSGDSAQKYLQGSKRMRVDNWILLDNLDKGRGASFDSRMRAFQTHSKRSKKHMSTKQLKKCGTFDLPKEFHNFDYFKPMHEMWKGYMKQLTKNVRENQLAQCLLTADLHGAMILVVHCTVASYTGLSGIMIRETAETFGVLTQDNTFRVVPKKLSVFIFQFDCWKITLQGDKLASRNVAS